VCVRINLYENTYLYTKRQRADSNREEDAKYKFLGSAARETDIFLFNCAISLHLVM
jgi:hypothetical protein